MTPSTRVAILGAGGRVGSALLRHLSAEGRVSAFGVCRNTVIAGPLRHAGFEVRCGSILDGRSAEALVGGADVVVNCAADSGWASTAREANRRPLAALASANGIGLLIQFSSIGVYGSCIARGRATADRPRPHARFAREKLDQEHAAQECARSGMTVIVLRMGHVYGPYQWLSRSIFEWLAAGTPPLPFDGELASNAIHIDNVCRAIGWLVSADARNGTYGLVDRPQRSWRALVDHHAAVIGATTLGGADSEASRRLARRYRARESVPLALQLARELGLSLVSLPAAFAVTSPSAIALGQRLLAAVGSPMLDARLRAMYAEIRARRSAHPDVGAEPPPWLLSDEIPGPVLPYPAGPVDDDRELADWYRGYAVPPALDEPRP